MCIFFVVVDQQNPGLRPNSDGHEVGLQDNGNGNAATAIQQLDGRAIQQNAEPPHHGNAGANVNQVNGVRNVDLMGRQMQNLDIAGAGGRQPLGIVNFVDFGRQAQRDGGDDEQRQLNRQGNTAGRRRALQQLGNENAGAGNAGWRELVNQINNAARRQFQVQRNAPARYQLQHQGNAAVGGRPQGPAGRPFVPVQDQHNVAAAQIPAQGAADAVDFLQGQHNVAAAQIRAQGAANAVGLRQEGGNAIHARRLQMRQEGNAVSHMDEGRGQLDQDYRNQVAYGTSNKIIKTILI